MNRVLRILYEQGTDATALTDRHLLDRFLTARDEAAFAELVRRYGPLVWGACRRQLVCLQDAEDAFQATFFVLLRRAARLNGDAPIGPWLYKVATMTARNVLRGNRRRTAITGPLEHDVPSSERDGSAEQLDLDAALLALPERDRAAVVLCHLQGLSRREAAEKLGCPEGTLSARLSRALQRLRARLGNGAAMALAGGAIALPAGLASATVRSATVYSTSTLTAAGVSPVVVGLTDGVLRMFLMKKVMTAAVVAMLVLGAGVLALGTVSRSEDVARAAEQPTPVTPLPTPEESDALKRLEKRLNDLEKQKLLLDATLEDLKGEKKRLEDAKRNKEEVAAMNADIVIVLSGEKGKPRYAIREVVDGKVEAMQCSNLGILTTYLTRAFNDPKGPKTLRVSTTPHYSADRVAQVFRACAKAGYAKATFTPTESRLVALETVVEVGLADLSIEVLEPRPSQPKIKPGEIDLTKYRNPTRP